MRTDIDDDPLEHGAADPFAPTASGISSTSNGQGSLCESGCDAVIVVTEAQARRASPPQHGPGDEVLLFALAEAPDRVLVRSASFVHFALLEFVAHESSGDSRQGQGGRAHAGPVSGPDSKRRVQEWIAER